MTDNNVYLWPVPHDIMKQCAKRVRELRIQQRIPQTELAERIGVAIGTIKRFERTGEIQFRALLNIALVLNRLDDFVDLFKPLDLPTSLYHTPESTPPQRARKKHNRPLSG